VLRRASIGALLGANDTGAIEGAGCPSAARSASLGLCLFVVSSEVPLCCSAHPSSFNPRAIAAADVSAVPLSAQDGYVDWTKVDVEALVLPAGDDMGVPE